MIGDFTIEVQGNAREIQKATREWLAYNEIARFDDFIYLDSPTDGGLIYDILSKHREEVESLADWLSSQFIVDVY